MLKVTDSPRLGNGQHYEVLSGCQAILVSDDMYRFLTLWHDHLDFSISVHAALGPFEDQRMTSMIFSPSPSPAFES